MATAIIPGQRTWSMQRDDEGHRNYKIKHLVRADPPAASVGPAEVLATPGLPLPMSTWDFDGDSDPYAYCLWEAEVRPQDGTREGDATRTWAVTQTFTTKPRKSCRDAQWTDPLLEPVQVSGPMFKYTEEGTQDRFGRPIMTSSFEQIRGKENEWDASRPALEFRQNVAALDKAFCDAMVNRVNALPVWGYPPRCVKLAEFTWEKKYFGLCHAYYARVFKFDFNPLTWDRDLLDEGTKALHGEWDTDPPRKWKLLNINGAAPDPRNPTHYDRFQDRKGNVTRVILDGAGQPWVPDLSELITTCSGCPLGTFKYLRVLGAESESVLLENQSGCNWAGTSGANTYTLLWDGNPNPELGTGYWALFKNGDEVIWQASADAWNCLGPNGLTRSTGAASEPPFVAVVPGSLPGRVHVEKYQEADFLLLGLPAVF